MANYAPDKDSRRSRTSRDGGSVPRVSPITGPANGTGPEIGTGSRSEFGREDQDLRDLLDFQSTTRLSQAASSALTKAFESGWMEPQKLHNGSSQLRHLIQEARESIAANLGVEASHLEFVGELGFGYWAAISGALRDFSGTFIHGVTDRQVVHAFARELINRGRRAISIETNETGLLDYEAAISRESSADQSIVVFWQGTNRETGIEQPEIGIELPANALLVADMTARISVSSWPSNSAVTIWDPRNFGGPEGLAILSINPQSNWRSPIPPIDKRRLFGSYSKPLLLLTAVALDESKRNDARDFDHLRELNKELRAMVKVELRDVQVIGNPEKGDPRNLALVVKDVAAEEILRGLEKNKVLIDAGSACGAGALSPSHVLEAMGFGSTGHLRITLKPFHTISDLKLLVRSLKSEIDGFRAI